MVNLDTILMEIVINSTMDDDANGQQDTDYTMGTDTPADNAGQTNQVDMPDNDYTADSDVDTTPDQNAPANPQPDTPTATDTNTPPAPEDDQATDYTSMGGGDDTAPPDDNPPDGGDNPPPDGDAGGGDNPPDSPDTDYSSMDPGDVGGGDAGGGQQPSGGDMNTPAGGGAHEASPDEIKEKNTKVKQLLLLNKMIDLYNSVQTYNKTVMAMERPNVLFSVIQNKVSDNFTKLYKVIFQYIMYYFDSMSYEYNYYAYNYFVEACKINIEMIQKIMDKTDIDVDAKK
jgi:hypothetical protein